MSVPISTSEARGAVEKWLLQVQDIMLMSVRDVVEKAVMVSHHAATSCSPARLQLCGPLILLLKPENSKQ